VQSPRRTGWGRNLSCKYSMKGTGLFAAKSAPHTKEGRRSLQKRGACNAARTGGAAGGREKMDEAEDFPSCWDLSNCVWKRGGKKPKERWKNYQETRRGKGVRVRERRTTAPWYSGNPDRKNKQSTGEKYVRTEGLRREEDSKSQRLQACVVGQQKTADLVKGEPGAVERRGSAWGGGAAAGTTSCEGSRGDTLSEVKKEGCGKGGADQGGRVTTKFALEKGSRCLAERGRRPPTI